MWNMVRTLTGRVVNGRLVVDEPTELPEGTEVSLAFIEAVGDLDEDEQAALEAALEESSASLRAGDRVAADDVVKELRARR